MVEYILSLDSVFSSLADATRRDILKRVGKKALSVGQIAKFYDISFAGVAKHLKVLEKAKLIIKHRKGKEQIVQLSPTAFKSAANYLGNYKAIWEYRFNAIDKLLSRQEAEKKSKYVKN